MYFNPRAPCGARQLIVFPYAIIISFQSTRPLRGATQARFRQDIQYSISIHAPLAGRDCIKPLYLAGFTYFNPRAPCGARLCFDGIRIGTDAFQSTRPLRGATPRSVCNSGGKLFQSTRPLRGATGAGFNTRANRQNFNPRAPCGARLCSPSRSMQRRAFQSTRPLRGATSAGFNACADHRNFNPRAPCGARRTYSARKKMAR